MLASSLLEALETVGTRAFHIKTLRLVNRIWLITFAVRSPGSRWFSSSEGDWRKVRTLQSSVPYENEGR